MGQKLYICDNNKIRLSKNYLFSCEHISEFFNLLSQHMDIFGYEEQTENSDICFVNKNKLQQFVNKIPKDNNIFMVKKYTNEEVKDWLQKAIELSDSEEVIFLIL